MFHEGAFVLQLYIPRVMWNATTEGELNLDGSDSEVAVVVDGGPLEFFVDALGEFLLNEAVGLAPVVDVFLLYFSTDGPLAKVFKFAFKAGRGVEELMMNPRS